jgi:hypothetical protein
MGEARRARLAFDYQEAWRATTPLHLQQQPLPAVLCPCLRPGWNPVDVMTALQHTECEMPYWLTHQVEVLV